VISFLTSTIVLAVVYVTAVAAFAIVAALRVGGRRDDRGDDHEALAASRFTIPVSIVVPLTKGVASTGRAVAALLDLNYPEFEVIVVADGSSQAVIDELARDWQLEAREFFYLKTIGTSEVRRIYRSARDSRLMVIDKAATGYSDTLNCGVNVARYRYFMAVGPDVLFDRDALLRVMTAALRDPANVVGASSHVEHGAEPAGDVGAGLQAGPDHQAGPDRQTVTFMSRMMALFQQLASARALMDSRLAWRYLGAGLGPTGAIVVWRRDAVVKLNGFSAAAADPAIDMMFRLQTRGVEGGGRFDRGVDVFGRVEPQSMAGALRMSWRRQLAALEVLAGALRHRTGALEFKTIAYFVASEVVTPLAELWIVIGIVAGASVGWFSWTAVILAIALLAFGNAAVSASTPSLASARRWWRATSWP